MLVAGGKEENGTGCKTKYQIIAICTTGQDKILSFRKY